MRFIHPVAWVGFFLNCALAYGFLASMDTIPPELYEQMVGEAVNMQEVLSQVRSIFATFLLFQALSFVLLRIQPKVGLLLGVLAGLVAVLPVSMVFILGVVYSYYAVIYDAYETAPVEQPGMGFVIMDWRPRRMLFQGLIGFGVGVLLLGIGAVSIGGFAVIGSLLYSLVALRVQRTPPFGLYEEYLALVPNLFAKRVMLPYSAIKSATLLSDETIQFTVMLKGSLQSFSWPLASIDPAGRKEIVQRLAETLTRNGVELM